MQTKQELRSFHLDPSERKTRAKLLLRATERMAEGIHGKKKKKKRKRKTPHCLFACVRAAPIPIFVKGLPSHL
jgi:hypothetical protein